MLQSLPLFQLTQLAEMPSVSPIHLRWAKCCFPHYGIWMALATTVLHKRLCNRLAWYISPDCLSNNWFHWSSTVLTTQRTQYTSAIFNCCHPVKVVIPRWVYSSMSRLRPWSSIAYAWGQCMLRHSLWHVLCNQNPIFVARQLWY